MRSYSCRPMRWWRRNAEPERSWKSGWRFWNAGIRRRERGWRDLRARCRGLRGSGDCLRHEAEQEDRIQNMTCVRTICQGGRRLVRKGMRRYVKARIAAVRFPSRRAKGLFSPPGGIGISDYSPVYFRHTPPPAIASTSKSYTGIPRLRIVDPRALERLLNRANTLPSGISNHILGLCVARVTVLRCFLAILVLHFSICSVG